MSLGIASERALYVHGVTLLPSLGSVLGDVLVSGLGGTLKDTQYVALGGTQGVAGLDIDCYTMPVQTHG